MKIKKSYLLSALALTFAMASCDNFDLPNPPGQENPEPEAIFENGDLSIEKIGDIYNLKEINANSEDVVLAKITELKNFPDGYTLSIDAVLSNPSDAAKSETLPTVINGNDEITVNPALVNGAIQSVITKAPGTYEPIIEFVAYAQRTDNENTRIRLGGIDKVYARGAYKIVTFDPDVVIEQSYYLVHAGKCTKMENTLGNNVNAYDAPEFAVKIDVPVSEAAYTWSIIPESAYNDGNPNMEEAFGCVAATETSGKLVLGAAAGQIEDMFGPILITINAENKGYNVNYALSALYLPTGANINKPQNAKAIFTDNYVNFSGAIALTNKFLLLGQPSVGQPSDVQFYPNGSEESEDAKGNKILSGEFTTKAPLLDADKRFSALTSSANLYWFDANVVSKTYSMTLIETLSVVGQANNWKEAEGVELVPSKDRMTWKTENAIELGNAFKIVGNGNWNVNFGKASNSSLNGNTGTLEATITFNSNDNIELESGDDIGKWYVTVDFSVYPYTVTLTK